MLVVVVVFGMVVVRVGVDCFDGSTSGGTIEDEDGLCCSSDGCDVAVCGSADATAGVANNEPVVLCTGDGGDGDGPGNEYFCVDAVVLVVVVVVVESGAIVDDKYAARGVDDDEVIDDDAVDDALGNAVVDDADEMVIADGAGIDDDAVAGADEEAVTVVVLVALREL